MKYITNEKYKEFEMLENTIEELESDVFTLSEEYNKLKERLSHKNELLHKQLKVINELNKEKNELGSSLNFEKTNSKKVINEIKSKQESNHQDYINHLDAYDKELTLKNEIINNYKTKLIESLNNLKGADNSIFRLKEETEINKNVRQELRKKKKEIINLNGQVHSLSKEVKYLSSLSYKNSILESKLQEAESFQNVINNKKDKFIQETGNVNTSKLISLLTSVSRKKQGNQKLTWEKWLNISENNYLLNLDEVVAKKVFNESNSLIQQAINSQGLKGQAINPIYGLEFDGSRQSLNTTFPEEDSEQTPTDRTYSWWMKSGFTATGTNRGCWGYGGRRREAFHLNESNKPELNLANKFLTKWDDIPEQDDGAWHHWMVFSDVSDPSSAKLYVDGNLIPINSSQTVGTLNEHDSTSLIIGGCDIGNDNGEHFEGSITNFAVFSGDVTNRAVSHYNNGIPISHSDEGELVGYWKMDESKGTSVIDRSSNNNHATFDGDEPTWTTAMTVTNTHHKGRQLRVDGVLNDKNAGEHRSSVPERGRRIPDFRNV